MAADTETDASAQLLEEQLQQRVLTSEGAREDGETASNVVRDEPTYTLPGLAENGKVPRIGESGWSANPAVSIQGVLHGGEDQDDAPATLEALPSTCVADASHREIIKDDEDADAEGEEDMFADDAYHDEDPDVEAESPDLAQERISQPKMDSEAMEDVEDGDDGQDIDEGVGAVKIKPGDTDEEDEEEADDSGRSDGGSNAESDGAAAWDQVAGSDEEEEEEEEAEPQNVCLFCNQDEDNDPAPDFETFLTCSGCELNAHQECARDAKAFAANQSIENWRCPGCALQEGEAATAENAVSNGVSEGQRTPARRRSSAPKLARDLLPSQKGTIKPDSHSVFNQLVLDEDPMDGSRVLRKRKTSSAEADEVVMALRKRQKNSPAESADDLADSNAAGRPMRPKTANSEPATIWKRDRGTLVMRFKVDPAELQKIISRRPKRQKKQTLKAGARLSRPASTREPPPVVDTALISTPFTSAGYSQPFYSFYDKDRDELKGKPYGGILTEAEADTSKTYPNHEDRKRFDDAKRKADEDWKQRIVAMQAEAAEVPIRRHKKSAGPASQIECIEFGGWEIDTWYAAPYPEEYSRNRVLHICEFCLKYMNSDYVAWRHKLKCPAKHPPGDEIYRHASVSVFEVDGRKNPVYCQNLCLLAKLFLGSKTLYYDVEPFLFYVLCEYDELGYHFVGYFSKEKRASSQNNVSCILTLPIHQRKGYGNLLIDFSYLLTRVEEKTGSPEKPLSDMGLVSYRSYWRLIMCRYLIDHVPTDKAAKSGLSIGKISDDTGLTPDDVVSSLEGLRCLVRDAQSQLYAFRVDLPYCRDYVAKWDAKNYVKLNEAALTWTPYVMGRTNASNFELGPALNAIAPREEEEEAKPGAVFVVKQLTNGSTVAPTEDEGTNLEDSMMREAETVDAAPAPAILPSTEADETMPPAAETNVGVEVNGDSHGHSGRSDKASPSNGVAGSATGTDGKQEQPSATATPHQPEATASTIEEASNDWSSLYAGIPPTRFQVYPPFSGAKRAGGRPPGPRPAVPRLTSSGSLVRRPRRSLAGGRRSTTSKPRRSSSFHRKSGGTGRGPGRWPKGTKKSDYGNAESGPGLPPAWIAAQHPGQLPPDREGEGEGEGEAQTKDTVQVQTLGIGKKPSEVVATFIAEANGDHSSGASTASRRPRSLRSSRSSGPKVADEDVDIEMDDDNDEEEEEEGDGDDDDDDEEEEEEDDAEGEDVDTGDVDAEEDEDSDEEVEDEEDGDADPDVDELEIEEEEEEEDDED